MRIWGELLRYQWNYLFIYSSFLLSFKSDFETLQHSLKNWELSYLISNILFRAILQDEMFIQFWFFPSYSNYKYLFCVSYQIILPVSIISIPWFRFQVRINNIVIKDCGASGRDTYFYFLFFPINLLILIAILKLCENYLFSTFSWSLSKLLSLEPSYCTSFRTQWDSVSVCMCV